MSFHLHVVLCYVLFVMKWHGMVCMHLCIYVSHSKKNPAMESTQGTDIDSQKLMYKHESQICSTSVAFLNLPASNGALACAAFWYVSVNCPHQDRAAPVKGTSSQIETSPSKVRPLLLFYFPSYGCRIAPPLEIAFFFPASVRVSSVERCLATILSGIMWIKVGLLFASLI